VAEDTISVIVSDIAPEMASRRSLEGLIDRTAARVEEFTVTTIATSLREVLEKIYLIAQDLPAQSGNARLSKVSFALAITASGKVSVMSAVGGEIGTSAGLTCEIELAQERK